MNIKTRDWLAELAGTLPTVYEDVRVRLTFKEAKMKDKKAKPSDTWLRTERRPVDHLKKLRIIYSRDREAGVEKYRIQAFEAHAKQLKEKPKTVSLL
jgi:ribosomal protein S12 methylthiotransferase accessory factor YcaO